MAASTAAIRAFVRTGFSVSICRCMRRAARDVELRVAQDPRDLRQRELQLPEEQHLLQPFADPHRRTGGSPRRARPDGRSSPISS